MKKRTLIVVGIVALILIIIGVIFIFSINHNKANPEVVLKDYMSCINDKNYDSMYELIDNANINREDFINRNKNIYEGINVNDLKIEISNTEEINNENTKINYVTYMQTSAGELSFSNSAVLTKKDNKYYIKWSSNLIFPELDNSDKVRISNQTAKRGSILDRNGKILAEQGTVSSVGLVPGKINKETKQADIEKIAQLLDIEVDTINKNLSQSYVKADTFVPIKMVSKSNYALKEQLLQIKGIMITDAISRVYPYSDKIAHLIGYVQNITAEDLKENEAKGYTSASVIGKSGLEKIYEDRLRGINGCEIYIATDKGTKKTTIAKRDVKDGENIKLTIDINIQENVYKEYSNDKSSTVVINPKTGEVLAMVSTPSYDSNEFVLGISQVRWNSISNDVNKPLYNRYQYTWAPGSSLKPVIGAIGLTTGKFTADEDFGTSGSSWQKNDSWGTYKVTTLAQYSGKANLQNALVHSDNIYFAKAALKIGSKTLKEQFTKIGFNTPIKFTQTMSASKFSNNGELDSEVQLADSGYGQGQMLVNPLHMASIYSSFVNEGNMIQPYIEYGKEKSYYIENAFSKEAANTIKQDLIQVVESPAGTAHSAKIGKVVIAGKTGTAEIKDSKEDENGTEIGWFNAFVADENNNNQFLIISMVQDVKDRGGSHYLLPKVKNIFEAIIK